MDVISFNLRSAHHALVAAILGYERGIGVRSGCFCAHPCVVRLLGLTEAEQRRWRSAALSGNRSGMPGMVRISFGMYNDAEDVDAVVEMLHRIERREHLGDYCLNSVTGDYTPLQFANPMFDGPLLSQIVRGNLAAQSCAPPA